MSGLRGLPSTLHIYQHKRGSLSLFCLLCQCVRVRNQCHGIYFWLELRLLPPLAYYQMIPNSKMGLWSLLPNDKHRQDNSCMCVCMAYYFQAIAIRFFGDKRLGISEGMDGYTH